MTIVILGDSFTFPEGNAATNHVFTYAKGFVENGLYVHVICFGNVYTDAFEGVSDGIKFHHPFRQAKRSRYFIVRRWQIFLKYIRTLRLVREMNSKDKIIAINLWSYLLLTQFFAFLLAKYIKTKLIIERSEHPLRYYNLDNPLQSLYGNIKVALELKLYDGIFCISNYLVEFFKKRGFNPNNLLMVPSTVDSERFRNVASSPLTYNYILYCGTLTILKDGVNILIESFRKIFEKHPEINLVLIGRGESFNEDEIILRNLVTRLNMEKRIIFLGQISRTDVPAYLSAAKILALARPRSIIADAGFPSKITEYLATGKPVVVTSVGEIPAYLKNDENAFLAEPDSVEAFSDKLEFVLNNYAFAQQVGDKGKELTMTVFNYKYQAGRMIAFIQSL